MSSFFPQDLLVAKVAREVSRIPFIRSVYYVGGCEFFFGGDLRFSEWPPRLSELLQSLFTLICFMQVS